MRPQIDLRFRPSLLIFVDEVGQRICEQFKAILRVARLDQVLWQSIALLQFTSGSEHAVSLNLDGQASNEEGTFAQMVERALKDVQASRRIGEIISAGYPVPNPRTQVYIVGDASQDQPARVLKLVQEQLANMACHTLVCSVLHTDQVKQETAGNPTSEMVAAGSVANEQIIANTFCYLYGERLTYPVPTFISQAESYYAAAEALFVLIATGLTTEPFFEEAVRGGTGPAAGANVGGLGTSLILCPQEALLEYGSLRLSIEMLDAWLRDLQDDRFAPSRQREVRASARGLVRSIKGEIQDVQERPLANEARHLKGDALDFITGRTEADLSILTRELPALLAGGQTSRDRSTSLQEPPDLYQQLYERSQALFALFWPQQVRRDYNNRRDHSVSWSTFVSQRAEQAVASYAEWDALATRAWDAVTQHICTELQDFIEKLCTEDEAGLGLATLAIDELEDRLVELRTNLRLWHRTHVRDYQAAQRFLADLASGPWVSASDGLQRRGSPVSEQRQGMPAEPVVMEDMQESILVSEPIVASIPSLSLLSPQFSEQEACTVQHLEQRRAWREQRVPSGTAQMLAAIPFLIAVLLTLLSFPWFPPTTEAPLVMSAFVVSIVVLGYGLLYGKRVWEVRQARADLLTFYRRYYAYLCEQREDQLRLLLLNVVQSKALNIRQRLDHMATFLAEMRAQLADQAGRIPRELFQGVAGSRDVFVVNGEMLQQEQKNTLDDAVEQLAKVRVRAPVETWHSTTQALNRHFLTEVGERFFLLSQQELQALLLEWNREVTRSYCEGPLVNLSAAMDTPEVWREALERAKQVVYQEPAGVQVPQWMFVCGRDADIQKGAPHLPGDVYPVRISGVHAWVLVAAFSRRASSVPYVR
ncbi:hypothetical protein KSF_110710 [Reticulibacter mediterranei]|uniref:Uncharacterized protein n=1 Tax=Reticulibacter mediterranei TaxID=2778369 RepID=A0A8J3IYU8_9CHLR|nr:hypothetical protein [Reticulibacter mediterranei]GHP01024.1 hypothetical protein KSF_110710 [Reticulibacter mediterranei]